MCTSLAYSNPISFRMKGTLQRGCPRMPSITRVEADYECSEITVNIQKYTGTVCVYIYNENGIVVRTTQTHIDANGSFTVDVEDLGEGKYIMSVILSNATYEGSFLVE